MEGRTSLDGPLDYVAFKYLSDNNSYQVYLCHQGKTELLALGSPEQIILHLPPAKVHFQQTNEIYTLQPAQEPKVASWFTKDTLDRFFHVVGASQLLRHACELQNEMSQLEEARRFHLVLYAEGDGKQSLSRAADTSYLEGLGLKDKANGVATTGDATKNELLHAMDVRLKTLREELTSTLDQAAGGPCSFQELADLLEFTQSFGSTELKSLILKYFSMSQHGQAVDVSDNCHSPSGTMCDNEDRTNMRKLLHATPSVSGHLDGRQTPTDSDESSDSSGESYNPTERSRPMMRSASPRRSASPMRRVQIGRSGSRRSTALTIKSLGFYPARERIAAMNRETENSSEDEDPKEVPKKPENSVRSMSVQDAISLFESKQRDLNLDFQKRRASAEIGASLINTKKSVLRRWSAGMEDNSTNIQDNTSSDFSQKVTENSLLKSSVEEKTEGDPPSGSEVKISLGNVETDNATDGDECKPAKNGTIGLLAPEVNENCDLQLTSSEWNLQKNVELNQVVLKMIENKPSGNQNQAGNSANKNILDVSSAQKGGFSEQYKEKRDAKLRGENAGKRAEKELKFRAMTEDLDRRKAETSNKSGHASAKQDQLEQSQRTLRNSSLLGNPKRENSKPIISRKAPIRSSPVSAMRTSSSSGASPRTSTTPSKTSNTPTPMSTSTAPIRKKQQPAPSPTRTNTRMERSQVQHSKNTTRKVQSEEKPTIKSKDNKKRNLIKKSSNSCGVNSHVPSATDDSTMNSAKPNFYNKVTKKSSVVPLESKPFLRKGTGIGPGVGPVIVKTKVAQLADSSKADVNLAQAQESQADVNVDASQLPEINEDQLKMDVAESGDCNNILNKFADVIEPDNKKNDVTEQLYSKADDPLETEATFSAEAPLGIEQMNAQEDVTDLIWAQMDQQEKQLIQESAPSEPTVVTPELSMRSPRVRHSLSQMLQADSGEAGIANEWGNAENPPALVYQKDSPKGFKRLLKFARKNRGGDSITTGWGSSPVLSEGEDDNDEPKGFNKRNIDALLRKSAPHVKGFGHQKAVIQGSYDGGNSSKRSLEYNALHEYVPKHFTQSSSPKLREDQVSSAAAASSKASRSFFSLSTFRSKGNEAKIR
ncbi:flocculation protein FLO11-like [Nymphaea colorata]|nr:flocculation protein FLO11-like [Nymphaea colorata]XP_031497220.1 flocculation protein FLO11-like [Nymphaea colorata]XP_031497221.1 flocculation protein FLO11-like [Nymphaea colorata]